MENRTLILGTNSGTHNITLHTNLTNTYLDSEGRLQCNHSSEWSKLLQIAQQAVYDIADSGLIPLFLHEYYKGKACFTFEIDIGK